MVAMSKLLFPAILVATDLTSQVRAYWCDNAEFDEGGFGIDLANAANAMNNAPFNTGRSGYPHRFQNHGGIRWPTLQCLNAQLYEFPVLLSGDLYDANSRPKDDPGPARVIYTLDRQPYGYKLFCGVVAHVGADGNPNSGRLELCN